MDKQAFIAAVKAAGIVGEGGAGFPAHVKYAADADTVIANGCECEPPFCTPDQHHMLHHANEIVRAFSELMQATGANVSGADRLGGAEQQRRQRAIGGCQPGALLPGTALARADSPGSSCENRAED